MTICNYFKGFAAVAIVTLLSLPALAHPALKSTLPAADEAAASLHADKVADASPKEIKLIFSETVVAKFSGLDLMDEAGKKVATGAPTTDPTDTKQLIVPLPAPLNPGKYTVNWHAVSEDTHRVKGQYSFTITQ